MTKDCEVLDLYPDGNEKSASLSITIPSAQNEPFELILKTWGMPDIGNWPVSLSNELSMSIDVETLERLTEFCQKTLKLVKALEGED